MSSNSHEARYIAELIHDGTDYAILPASPEDVQAGWAMTHDQAVDLCRAAVRAARRAGHRCAWFDLSAAGGAA